jgi:predicted nucleotidyltransferase
MGVLFSQGDMVTTSDLPIRVDTEKVAAFCRERGIRKLSLFGSVLREDFDLRRSDVDVLIEFLPGRTPGWEYFAWGEDLSGILGRRVDLCSQLNKQIEGQVRREALTIYEQT